MLDPALEALLDEDIADELDRTGHPVPEAKHYTAKALLAAESGDDRAAMDAAVLAKKAANRSWMVREILGLAAYGAGEHKVALTELLAVRRLTGAKRNDPKIADAYRAGGRSERALAFLDPLRRADVDAKTWVEAIAVRASALDDLGNREAAIAVLNLARLTETAIRPPGFLPRGVSRNTVRSRPRKSGKR